MTVRSPEFTIHYDQGTKVALDAEARRLFGPPLPRLALSVRQPWAWAIIHAGKDIENRDWRHPNPARTFRGPFALHAASGMTRDEYDDAAETICDITRGVAPPARELARGAIIGVVEVVDVVRGNLSDRARLGPWFFGPVGLVLRNPRPITPIPCKGQLGFFEWRPSGGEIAPPAKWMLPPAPKGDKPERPAPAKAPDLFGGDT